MTLNSVYTKIRTPSLLGEKVEGNDDPDDLVIAEGGAAATAYARLQFEDMKPETRVKINTALLRYCELDTLAMVMIVQGWSNLIRSDTVNPTKVKSLCPT